jgi:hypothetical protein
MAKYRIIECSPGEYQGQKLSTDDTSCGSWYGVTEKYFSYENAVANTNVFIHNKKVFIEWVERTKLGTHVIKEWEA